jgi:hypothetical protein
MRVGSLARTARAIVDRASASARCAATPTSRAHRAFSDDTSSEADDPPSPSAEDVERVRALLARAKIDEKHADKFTSFERALGAKSERLKALGLGVKERKAFLRAANLTRTELGSAR